MDHTTHTEHAMHVVEAAEPRVPTIGDHILYVLPDGQSKGQNRPAAVVRTWGTTLSAPINLQVFIDGYNDVPYDSIAAVTGQLWKTSVQYSSEPKPGTWHWPAQKA